MRTDRKTVLLFDYRMQLDYMEPVQKAFFQIKAIPASTNRQIIRALDIRIDPETPLSENRDGFGNQLIYGTITKPHTSFTYQIRGRVEIDQILFEAFGTEEEKLIFRNPHGLNRPGDGLKAYFASIKDQLEENAYVNAVYLMQRVFQDYAYQKGLTDIRTDAEAAWRLGAGVCQDYVHIYLALCHMAGIPARYVAGIISGEGESHAWAEILYQGRWIGMDPTNGVLVAGAHIRFAHGRDAADCQLNRGIIYGGGKQSQDIRVLVTEEGCQEDPA